MTDTTFPGQCPHTIKVGGWELRCRYDEGHMPGGNHMAVVMSNDDPEHIAHVKWNHTRPSWSSVKLQRFNQPIHALYRAIRDEQNERMNNAR